MVYFNKIHHPLNFRFSAGWSGGSWTIGSEQFRAEIKTWGGGVTSLKVSAGRWPQGHSSQAELTHPEGAPGGGVTLDIGSNGLIQVKASADSSSAAPCSLLQEGRFGVSGSAWMLEFQYNRSMRFYGLGEKVGGFEKTGVRTKFWNTDVWADFYNDAVGKGHVDPVYVSIPYVVVKLGATGQWLGILLNNPFAPFISTGGSIGSIAGQKEMRTSRLFYFGAETGPAEVWFISGSSLAELTKRYQRLVGVTPLPPLWSLGHHQCRWGYASFGDLMDLKQRFAAYRIPNSGLWLDIDYMSGYRVFTWSSQHWGDEDNPEVNARDDQIAEKLAELQADGQRVVPILDPGVKNEPGFYVLEDGLKANAFCKTPEGLPFVGFVWPGETLFPDYSQPEVREWWAGHVEKLAKLGVHGAWLDMNDPAVGPVELDNMCFGPEGKEPHASYHSQYGMGMAQASKVGFLQARPDERPFLLARSGYTSCQRFAALWTGDNMSNDAYFDSAIPTSLNLALSGVAFNGPDVPGFGCDASEILALRWYQQGFLFPMLRNHSAAETRAQEPYSFSVAIREAIAHYIRLRYRLLPYLYQLWIEHEEEGSAVMRPLLYDFEKCGDEALDTVGDQFLTGPAIMQAPMTASGENGRHVRLPGDLPWYDLSRGAWESGNRTVWVDVLKAQEARYVNRITPMYARSGFVVPMQPRDPEDHKVDLSTVDLHCFVRAGETSKVVYRADDGESFAYQRGVRTVLHLTVSCDAETLLVTQDSYSAAWKPLVLRFVVYGGQTKVTVRSGIKETNLVLSELVWAAAGESLTVPVSAEYRPA